MEIKTQAKIFKKKKKDPFKIAIFFLVLVVVLTLGLYFYNSNLEKEIEKLDSNISKKTESINELKKDSKIMVSKIYNNNKSSIDKLNIYSRVPLFIDHMYKIRRVYGLDLKGFQYDSGNIRTQVIAKSEAGKINYQKVYKFLTEYRKSKNSLFDLKLVKSIKASNDNVADLFAIDLELKRNIKSILVDIETKNKEKKEEIKKQIQIENKTNTGAELENNKKIEVSSLVKEKIQKLKQKKD